MVLLESLTVLGIALSEPAVVVVSLNLFDMRPALTLEHAPNVLFERSVILKNLLSLGFVFIRPDGEEGQGFYIGFFGKHMAVQVLPWDVRVTCGFLMGPEHTESRATVDGGVYDLVPVKRKVLGQFQNNFSPKLKSLISGDYQVWPVNMDP